jgi:hypothetical protein
MKTNVSQGSSVSTVSGYGLDDRAIETRFLAEASVSRLALGPTQPPVQLVQGVLSPGVKARPGRDADHSPPSSAEAEIEQELYLLSTEAPSWRVVGQL